MGHVLFVSINTHAVLNTHAFQRKLLLVQRSGIIIVIFIFPHYTFIYEPLFCDSGFPSYETPQEYYYCKVHPNPNIYSNPKAIQGIVFLCTQLFPRFLFNFFFFRCILMIKLSPSGSTLYYFHAGMFCILRTSYSQKSIGCLIFILLRGCIVFYFGIARNLQTIEACTIFSLPVSVFNRYLGHSLHAPVDPYYVKLTFNLVLTDIISSVFLNKGTQKYKRS